jgi:hypothetical protein
MKRARRVHDGCVIALMFFGGTLVSLAPPGASQEIKTGGAAGQQSGAPEAGRASVASPYLQLVGTILGGSAAALPGDEVAVFGSEFCARSDCSDVILSIGGHVVLQGIKPNGNGSFTARFRVTEPPGLYLVRASQQAGQTKLEDGKPLIVPVRD